MRLQHIFKQLSEEMATAAAATPPAAKSSNGEFGYGKLDKVLAKIESALVEHKGKNKGIVILDFGEPAVQMDLSVSS